MIQVKAPDGSIAQFPDGMSDDAIAGVMRQTFGGPEDQHGATGDWGYGASGSWEPQAAPDHEAPGGIAALVADQLGVSRPRTWRDTARDWGASIAQGATFGYADEARAGLDSLRNGASYDQEMAKNKAELDAIPPSIRIPGEVAGGIASLPVAGGAGVAAKGVSLIGRMGRGLLSGTVLGGVSGAGHADPGKRIAGAESGATTGAIVGAFAPPVVGGIAKGVGAVKNAARGAVNADARATQAIKTAMKRDGLTYEQALARLDELGPDAVLADVGGPNLLGRARAVATMPGAGQTQAVETLEGRQAGQGERLIGTVGQTLSGKNLYATTNELMAGRKAAADPLYAQAFDQTAASPRLQQFVNDPIMRDGLGRGLTMERLDAVSENRPFDPHALGITFDEAGNPQFGSRMQKAVGDFQDALGVKFDPGFDQTPAYNMRVLDAAKRGLDAMVADARDPITGRLSPEGRAINNFLHAYTGELDNLNPTYAQARDTFAGPSRILDAVSLGRAALSDDPEVIADSLSRMTASEKEGFTVGLARAIRDKIEATPDGSNAVRRIFGNPAMRNRLEAAFPSPEAFRAFADQVSREGTFNATRNAVLQGSRTAPSLAEQNDLGVMPGWAADTLKGTANGGLYGGLATAARRMTGRLQEPSDDMRAAMARILMSNNDSEAMGALQQAWNKGQTNRRIQALAGMLLSSEAGAAVGSRR